MGYTDGFNSPVISKLGPPREMFIIPDMSQDERRFHDENADAFQRDSGIFTAPMDGVYKFSWEAYDCGAMYFYLAETPFAKDLVHQTTSNTLLELEKGQAIAIESRRAIKTCTATNLWRYQGQGTVSVQLAKAGASEKIEDIARFFPVLWKGNRYSGPISDVFLSSPKRISFPTRPIFKGTRGLLYEEWLYSSSSAKERPTGLWSPHCGQFGPPLPPLWLQPNFSYTVDSIGGKRHANTLWGARPGVWYYRRFRGLFQSPVTGDVSFSLWVYGVQVHISVGTNEQIESAQVVGCNHWDVTTSWLPMEKGKLYYFEVTEHQHRDRTDLGGISGLSLRLKANPKSTDKNFHKYVNAAPIASSQDNSDSCHTTSDATNPDDGVTVLKTIPSGLLTIITESPTVTVSSKRGVDARCVECDLPPAPEIDECPLLGRSLETDYSNSQPESIPDAASFVPDRLNLDDLRLHAVGLDEHRSLSTARQFVLENRERVLLEDKETTEQYERWSDQDTWGGRPPDELTEIVYIPAGKYILLDVPHVSIRIVVVEGTLKVSGDIASCVLETEALIVNGENAKFIVGTITEPFLGQFNLRLLGHWRSPVLPVFGIKVLGATKGASLSMVGKETVSWTRLATSSGDGNVIVLVDPVDWKAGDKIIVSSTSKGSEVDCSFTRDDSCETEEREVKSINLEGDQVTLDRPLRYLHIGGQRIGNHVLSSEVAKLSRNIVIEGVQDDESKSFGGHVMMLNQKSVFQFVELKNVGQAFQLGRYPLHFHLVENADQSVSESIVKGCSIHSSFNRALVCHACNNLRVYQNVAYKVLGHTFFLEDGVESGNDFVGNLGVLTMRSFSLLETDQTPATFWITNANNKFVGNVAAGAHSFGFWINLPEHSGGFTPRGASFSQAKWPGLESSMLDMKGNIAHSNGAAGFFFSGLDPRKQIRLTRDPRTRKLHAVGERTVLTLRDFFTFGNGDSGIMAEHVGHVHFKGVTSAHEPIGFNLLSVIADKWATEENNYDGFLLHEAFFLSNSICGFGTGLSDFGMFMNITLKDMPVGICGIAALNGGIDRETTHADIGGVEARTSRLTFINTRLPVAFSAPFQAIYYDIDGSLTGIKGGWAHAANGKGLDSLGHFPPDDCTLFSSGHYIFCDSNVVLRTFRWASPRQPLYGKQNALITTSHGSSYVGTTSYSITGVMGALRTTLVMGMKHQITFPFMLDEIEYTGFKNGELCGLRKDDPVALVSFPVLSKPDHFNIFKQSNTLRFPDLLHPPEWYGKARLGSWKLEESSISFVASSTTASGLALGTDEQPASNRGYGTTSQVCIQGGMERVECPQIGCSLMTCVHQTMDTSEQGETSVLFSDLGITDGESVLIPKGQTVLFDIERSPVFDRFEVYGKLVLDDTGPRELSARHIIVHRGGEFEIGSKEKRFQHDARIVLVGKNDDDAYEGTSLGSKFLAVFGRLIMYGREKEQSETLVRSALKSDIQPGATQMEFYSIPVGLQIGDRLLVTTCTLVANETETVQVTNIDSVFVYTTAFEYTHLKRDTLMNGRIEPSLGTHVAILGQPNIRIEGSSDPDSFGASIKVLRGSLFCDEDQDDEDALNQSDGYAEIDHVHFLNCGQYGRSPCLRFGVMGQSESRRNLQCSRMMFRSVDGENSFVTNSVFEGGVHTGIALVNTVGVRVQGNVIDNRAGTGVLVFGHHNIIENNLVSRARFFRFPRSWYQSVTLDLLPDEGICFDVFGFQNQVRGNIAAGSDLVGFFVPGEPCSTPLGERLVNGNIAMASPKGVEVRGYTFCDLRKQVPGVVYPDWPTTGNVGVREFYHVNDGVPRTCIVASGYTIVRTMVFGINSNGASGVTSSLVLEHNELIDTGIAISRIASQGTSVAPISTKSINSAKDRDVSRPDLHLLINSSRIVGSSYRCHQVGVIPASFYEKSYSLQPLWSIGNRVALLGGTSIFNVSFTGFGQYDASSSFSYAGNPYHISECTSTSVNYVISMEPERQPLGVSPDFSKVVLVERITLHGDNQLLNFPWAPTAGVYGVGDSGCAQFPCDGSRNGLLIDLDGSFIGTPGTAVAENEQYFHDDLLYIDPLGAKTMRDLIPQTVNLDTWKPGIGALDACTKKHNHYICPGGKHRQLLIEDMESTSFERRIAPVAMVVADRISLLTGPKNYDMKKSWGGAASIHRDNNFCPIGVLDELNQVHFTSSPPKRIRIHLRDVKQSEGLLVGIWFNLPNGFDIYADNTPVKGTLLELPIDGKGVCTDQSKHGYSYYSPLKSGLLFVCVVGTTPITINMKPVVRIGLAAGGWKELTREEFFQTGYEGFVSNVALLLGIPKDRIAFAGQKNQSPAERRVLVEHPTEDLEDEFLLIINPPVLEDSLDSFDEHAFGKVAARQVEELKTIAGNASKLVESGDLSAVFASNVPEAELHSVGIIRPKKVIPGWTGPIEHYNASDGCDCSYGILDPDCLTQTNIPVRGCSTVYRKTGASELQDLEAENEQQSQVNAEEIREKESICSSQNSTDACALAECCYSDAQGCGLCEAATEDIMKGENYCATNTIKEIEHGFCDYTLPNWSIQGTKYAEGPDAPQVSCDCNPGDMWDPDCELGENIPIIGCPMDSINPPICFQTLDGKASCGKQVNGRRVTSAQRKKWSYACDCDFSDMSKCLRDCKENRGLWGWTCDEKQFNRFKLASSSILDQCTA
uniref:G8 domain-containing protein n=1 Tax=Mucochytrium quahogii TaxID=96639 RepID=A0A7S2WHY1_9STRA